MSSVFCQAVNTSCYFENIFPKILWCENTCDLWEATSHPPHEDVGLHLGLWGPNEAHCHNVSTSEIDCQTRQKSSWENPLCFIMRSVEITHVFFLFVLHIHANYDIQPEAYGRTSQHTLRLWVWHLNL